MRRLLTPRWIAGHLLVAVTIAAFVSLGFWQLRRLDEKRTFNAGVESGLALPPLAAGEALDDGIVYRRIEAAGVFDTGHEALVLRSRDGVSGYHVITPFVLEGGRGILVDRGWLPIQYDAVPVTDAPPPAGTVTITGLLWPPQSGSSGVSGRLPDVVRRIDPAIWAAAVPYDLAGQYLVLDGDDNPAAGLPIAAPPPTLPEGPHLGYAVQWFLFTGVVVVGYPLLLAKSGRSSVPSPPG